MQTDHIAVVVLAAGQSSRFGNQKMSHFIGNGKTILRACIEQYQKVFSHITVVISNDANLKQEMAKLKVNVVVVNDPTKGMSQSLIAGIQSQANADAWLIGLGDMPYVKTQTLTKLAASSTRNNIVVPVCSSRRGNPVIFGCEFQTGLLSLQGDVGAKQLVNTNQLCSLEVSVDDIGVLHDIDRPEDVL